jgi:hypothetical protein
MKRAFLLLLILTSAAAIPQSALASDVIFRARGIDFYKPFVCSNKTIPGGRHDIEVSWDETSHSSVLTVFKGDLNVCETSGANLAGSQMPGSKIHIVTRIDPQKKAVEIEMIIPTGLRDRIPSQVFFLPLAERD